MHYTQEMMLQSTSGYCMPFEERDKDVEMSLGYGRQKHPQTGEMFFHHGIDFKARRYILAALATEKQEEYGTDRLLVVLNRFKDLSQKNILKHTRRDIKFFVGEEDQFDDVTMLGFKYNGQS